MSETAVNAKTGQAVELKSDSTPNEVAEAITGFDEIAVLKRFGHNLAALGGALGNNMVGRALIYTDLRQKGVADEDAYQISMKLSNKQVGAYFAEETEEAEGN